MNYTITFPENYVKPILPDRNKWIEALRSGEYEQGFSELKRGNQYCCLGVLQTLQNIPISQHDNVLTRLSRCHDILGRLGYFPCGVCVNRCGVIANNLSNCNDLIRMTFEEIAEIIEQVWAE